MKPQKTLTLLKLRRGGQMKKFLLASEELAVEMEKLEAQLMEKGTGVHVEVEMVEESRRRIQELYLQVSRWKEIKFIQFFSSWFRFATLGEV